VSVGVNKEERERERELVNNSDGRDESCRLWISIELNRLKVKKVSKVKKKAGDRQKKSRFRLLSDPVLAGSAFEQGAMCWARICMILGR
jgi:hypothetical protein